MASYQYVYVMKGLTKIYPGGREVLDNVYAVFLPGAKIGVLGINGAGKSTLMKIMAGMDKDFGGEAWAAEGARVGYLAQEPQLDPSQDRAARTSWTALRGTKALLDRFNEISHEVRRADDREEMNALLDRTGRAAGEDRRRRRLGPRPHGRHRDGRAALPARTSRRSPRCRAASAAAWRCAGCCCRSPTCCCSTSRPTIWTPNRWPGWSGSWHDYTGTVVAVTHDRYFLDNVAGWILELDRGRGIPYEGNYTAWLEQKRKRLEQEDARRKPAASDAGARAGVDRADARRPARPRARRASPPTRTCWPRAASEQGTEAARSSSRPARAWATW